MDAMEAIRTRRSVRKFTSKEIPKDVLEGLVDAGRLAPTAINVQPWEFVVVTERSTLSELAEQTDYGVFIADAAACIVVFCKDTKYYLEDGCAAVENILIAAAAQGIGSCWVAGDKKAYCSHMAEVLGAPSDMRLIALLALGYPADSGRGGSKRSLAEVIHWENF